ncbi:MAG: L-2-hydroxyglutarate oxidase [Thermoanaerobaculia bacterium]
MTYDFAVIGGGIVGLATARELQRRRPGARIAVVEKEPRWAAHQTGHNSGVIHSGIYYNPGSMKARLGREGNRSMVRFCEERGIPYDVCGKVIVATRPDEVPRLDAIYRRARENGIEARQLTPMEAVDREPHLACLAAVIVPSTGIVNYALVCEILASDLKEGGADLFLGTNVTRLESRDDVHRVHAGDQVLETRFLIACAGLQSDRIAKLDGVDPCAQIVPFRGEYYELRPERRGLVRHLIYPVPNPDFPFLGVHFTRMIDGSVHAGPNAVLAFKREGYRKSDFSPRDLGEALLFPGFWRLAARNMREGMREMRRSFSKRLFTESLRQMIPEIREHDLVPATAGVRAQAMRRDGALVDDFLIVRGERSLHVCNAPSPAATASLEIAKEIVDEIDSDALSS